MTATAATPAAATRTTAGLTTAAVPAADAALGPLVRKLVAKRSFASLATSSAEGRAHSAGVLYDLVDGDLWISTMRSSRKARNVAENHHAAVTIPVRRLPVGPPSSVLAQGIAVVVDLDDPELRRLAAEGRLPTTTGHGELELPDGCFLRIALPARVPVYGLGMPLLELLRNPIASARTALVDWT